MNITINSKKKKSKIIFSKLKTISLLLLLTSGIFIAGIYISDPILDSRDHEKFNNLNTQLNLLVKEITVASDSAETWEYSTSCSPLLSGDWPTGDYNCTALLSTSKTIASLQDFNSLQQKYYPLIDNSEIWRDTPNEELNYTDNFGNNFAVSLAYKKYNENLSNIGCTYTIQLNQTANDNSLFIDSDGFGSQIDEGQGKATISLKCNDVARDYWYTISDPSQRPSPDSPMIRQ